MGFGGGPSPDFGRFIGTPQTAGGATFGISVLTLYLAPIFIPASLIVDQLHIAAGADVAGTSGKAIAGLWKDIGNENPYQATLVVKAAVTFVNTGASMDLVFPVNSGLTPGLYWIGIMFDVGGGPALVKSHDIRVLSSIDSLGRPLPYDGAQINPPQLNNIFALPSVLPGDSSQPGNFIANQSNHLIYAWIRVASYLPGVIA